MGTSIDYAVQQQNQSTSNTCWAAATAMLRTYRGEGCSDMDVVADLRQYYADSVWDDGATQLELGQVAAHYGFTQIYPACWTPEGWAQQLEENGPMLIVMPGNAYHAIVVAGIEVVTADDEEQAQASLGDSKVHVHDPWYGERWLTYTEFEQQYELAGTGWNNNVYRT